MKRLVHRLLNRFGYSIERLPQASPALSPFAAMRRLLHGVAAPMIFDVGAHHGRVTATFRECFPRATIYAFEPFAASFEVLKANTASDPGVRAFDFGLGDRNGVQSFHANASTATNSLLATDAAGTRTWGAGLLETREVVQARIRTLDDVVAELRIPQIDLLKLDVQGAEPLVMAGAVQSCRRGRIRLLYAEIITQPTYQGQKRFDEALAAYYGLGFDLYNIYNASLDGEGRLRQVDVIFTRKRSAPDERDAA
jgi:FkbM family methyltransferase